MKPVLSYVLVALTLGVVLVGCRPDLGTCDEARARTIVYTDDIYGWPAYEGQALVEASCGGRSGECHSSMALGEARHGAPAGLDFDLTVLNAQTADASTDPLRNGQRQVYRYRYDVMRQVQGGTMPPGDVGSSFVTANTHYLGLPSIDSAQGQDILRNWLACGAPVVERTQPLPNLAQPTVGAIVATNVCPDPTTEDCGVASCIDTSSDPMNCGGCGITCLADPRTCSGGRCDCPAGSTRDSNNNCISLTNDPANCGSIGNQCPPGVGCTGGVCACADATLAVCSTGCKDLASDAQNCSGCGLACPPGATCSGATCVCGTGLSACIAGCVDTQSDISNCGACENVCPSGQVCFGGQCLAGGCPGTTTDCSGSCVDLTSNSANCGSCGNLCTVAGTTCSGGLCTCPSQAPTLCGSACVDTTSDAANCGACGNVCAPGAVCSGSACVCPSAAPNLCSNGCFDFANDSQNCGACGNVCASGSSCSGGSCACQTAGFTACASGCVDLTSDATNCGSCGYGCPSGQACSSGVCSAVSFSRDIVPIFLNQCALSGCHTGRRPASSLALDASTAFSSLVGTGTGVAAVECTSPSRLRVAPGAPDSSYLIDKLLGTNLCQGNQMPKIGTYLPAQQIDMIRAWILAGAPNN